MNFYDILEQVYEGYAHNPYAGKTEDGQWVEGFISIDFLNENFGQYSTPTEMKNATTSEGLKRFFDYLVAEGKLQP